MLTHRTSITIFVSIGANCTRLANGPNPKVWMYGAGCGVLTAEDGSRVLVATANRGDKRTQILDLSKPGASWKFRKLFVLTFDFLFGPSYIIVGWTSLVQPIVLQ